MNEELEYEVKLKESKNGKRGGKLEIRDPEV
jgi:hypothetical protein